MRIAISGAHATGKSTLVAELSRRLPHYLVMEETFYELLAEGHAFEALPSIDDVQLMLDRSCSALATATGADALFDRCPADYLGYLFGGEGASGSILRAAIERAARAMPLLDLVVFVPIEHPDRIVATAIERPRLRRRVDDALREIVVNDSCGLGARAIEVTGTTVERAEQVLATIARRSGGGVSLSTPRA